MRIYLISGSILGAMALAACNTPTNPTNSASSAIGLPSVGSSAVGSNVTPITEAEYNSALKQDSAASFVSRDTSSAGSAQASDSILSGSDDLAALPKGKAEPITIKVSDDDSFDKAAMQASEHCSQFGMKPGAPFMRDGGSALEYRCN